MLSSINLATEYHKINQLKYVKHSPIIWALSGAVGISITLYLVQAAGMQDIKGPLYFFQARWYFVVPLIIAFAVQLGLLRAINIKAKQNVAAVAATGGVSAGSMAACCAHNFVAFIPYLGLTGVANFLSEYQNYIFGISIAFAFGEVAYMWYRYKKLHACCHD